AASPATWSSSLTSRARHVSRGWVKVAPCRWQVAITASTPGCARQARTRAPPIPPPPPTTSTFNPHLRDRPYTRSGAGSAALPRPGRAAAPGERSPATAGGETASPRGCGTRPAPSPPPPSATRQWPCAGAGCAAAAPAGAAPDRRGGECRRGRGRPARGAAGCESPEGTGGAGRRNRGYPGARSQGAGLPVRLGVGQARQLAGLVVTVEAVDGEGAGAVEVQVAGGGHAIVRHLHQQHLADHQHGVVDGQVVVLPVAHADANTRLGHEGRGKIPDPRLPETGGGEFRLLPGIAGRGLMGLRHHTPVDVVE